MEPQPPFPWWHSVPAGIIPIAPVTPRGCSSTPVGARYGQVGSATVNPMKGSVMRAGMVELKLRCPASGITHTKRLPGEVARPLAAAAATQHPDLMVWVVGGLSILTTWHADCPAACAHSMLCPWESVQHAMAVVALGDDANNLRVAMVHSRVECCHCNDWACILGEVARMRALTAKKERNFWLEIHSS